MYALSYKMYVTVGTFDCLLISSFTIVSYKCFSEFVCKRVGEYLLM